MAATKYIIGAIVDTPKGQIRILSVKPGKRLQDGKRQHPRAAIEFLATGTVIDVQTTNIAAGKISDYREKTVYGVGYLGSQIKIPPRENASIVRRIYDLWANMLKRAYGNYACGYDNVTVDVRWHNFTNFLSTIQEIPCYSLWEKEPSKYCFDKDIRYAGNRMYSMDTCTFVPAKINVAEASFRRWHGTSASM